MYRILRVSPIRHCPRERQQTQEPAINSRSHHRRARLARATSSRVYSRLIPKPLNRPRETWPPSGRARMASRKDRLTQRRSGRNRVAETRKDKTRDLGGRNDDWKGTELANHTGPRRSPPASKWRDPPAGPKHSRLPPYEHLR